MFKVIPIHSESETILDDMRPCCRRETGKKGVGVGREGGKERGGRRLG